MFKKLFFILSSALLVSSSFAQNPVAENGQLQVIGHQLCNEQGKPYQLKGMSMFGLMHYPQCITNKGFTALRDDWKSNVVRATVFVADYSNTNNYNQNPTFNKVLIDSIVSWSEKLGLYCIIDWHVLNPGDPNGTEYKGADAFFDEMSTKYKGKKNIIYEICNEPNGQKITWDSIAKYSNRIMPIIRKNDPKAIILIGTPDWCKQPDLVDTSKLNDNKNVMFTFHFYAATHKALYSMFATQIHRIPIFVSEWGTPAYNGNGTIDTATSSLFLKTMNQHVKNNDTVSISWCNFSYADKNETASALKPGSCYSGLWNNTTASGYFIKYWIINGKAPSAPITLAPEIEAKKEILFNISPNPAVDYITLQSSIDETVSVSIYNLLGNEVIAPFDFDKNSTINISSLVRGTYLIVFKTNTMSDYRFFIKN
jgi:hypothetical protein